MAAMGAFARMIVRVLVAMLVVTVLMVMIVMVVSVTFMMFMVVVLMLVIVVFLLLNRIGFGRFRIAAYQRSEREAQIERGYDHH
jgi:hypothetical protein